MKATQEVACFAWALCGGGHDGSCARPKPREPSPLWGCTSRWKLSKQLGQPL